MAVEWAQPVNVGYAPAAPRSTSSSYTSDSNVPDISELDRPQSTKPVANPAKVCHVSQVAKPAA
jgi:hypothetical protein